MAIRIPKRLKTEKKESEIKEERAADDKVNTPAELIDHAEEALWEKDPVGAHSVNNQAIKNMLSMLSSEQRVIMPTTNSAYGSGNSENFCDENSPLNPISKYALDKVEIEKELMSRSNSISLRLATVFGMSPRMRLDLLVNDFTYRAVTDGFLILFEGHFKRNYIHVIDIARVFIHGIENFDQMNGEVYNVGGHNEKTNIEVVKTILLSKPH